ncbi:MAG: UDP-3-O-(3-hydroxymyristoyl)glucosamine N-acyltransferase [Phycisphaerae bacterium]
MPRTFSELGELLTRHGFRPMLEGDPNRVCIGVATLEEAGPGQISFLSNPKYERLLATTRASAVVLKPEIKKPPNLDAIRVADPYAAITALIVELHGYRRHRRPAEPSAARIDPSADIGENAAIHPGVTIDADVTIGRNAIIYPGCYIGPRCRIGDDVLLYPNVVIYDDCVLGNRVAIHAGTVVGNDGLGYAPLNGRWFKIPQIGIVEIGDDVEIGSNCSIDRATLGRTRIGRGTKMSNLIAIGHGTQIGEECLLVAQVGLAGSVIVGNHVTLAGQCGVVGHVRIGDNATVGARAGVTNSVPDGETVLGEPAIPIRDMKRQVAYIMRLPELNDSVRQMDKRLAALENGARGLRDGGEDT